MQAVTHGVGVLQAQCALFEEAVEDLKQESAIMEKHQRLEAGRPTKAVKGALKIGSRLMQGHGEMEFQAAARDMGYDVSAASRSDLAEMISQLVSLREAVSMSGDGREAEERQAGGRGRAAALGVPVPGVGWAGQSGVRGRGRTTGLRGPQSTPTASRGQRAKARELAAAAGDIDLRDMELDRAADLAVLGGDGGCKLSHTDLSSPAQPWAGAPQVVLAEASPRSPFLE
jgi:hypothetical protein